MTNASDPEIPEPTTASRIGEAGEVPSPGHPNGDAPAVPSAGEQLSRGTEDVDLNVPGDENVMAREAAEGSESPTEHMPG